MSSVACNIGSNANLSIRADSLTSNCLSREERAAIRRSDRKAGQVLGVTLTRDVNTVGKQLFSTPFPHYVNKYPLTNLTPSFRYTHHVSEPWCPHG